MSKSLMIPTRSEEDFGTHAVITVKPPALAGDLPAVRVHLTPDQYLRYREWREGIKLIQDALPDLTDSEREKLLSGLDDDGFSKFAGGDE